MSNKLITAGFAALAILALLLGVRGCNERDRGAHYKQAFEALNDSVHVYRNKQGNFVARISVLTVERAGLLAVAAGKDKQLAELQRIVAADKAVTSATVFHAVTSGKASGATSVLPLASRPVPVSSSDTGRVEPCPPAPLPTYQSTVSGDGITAQIEAGPDSTRIVSYQIEQDYSVAVTSRRHGLFKPKVSTVEVTALSPGGKVTAVRSFEVPADKPRRGVLVILGAVLGAVGVLLL